jgi:hypothetical protein
VIQNDSRTEGKMRLKAKVSGCEDGTCPAFYPTSDPELVAVQGSELLDPEALADLAGFGGKSADERVILVPRSLLARYGRHGQ